MLPYTGGSQCPPSACSKLGKIKYRCIYCGGNAEVLFSEFEEAYKEFEVSRADAICHPMVVDIGFLHVDEQNDV